MSSFGFINRTLGRTVESWAFKHVKVGDLLPFCIPHQMKANRVPIGYKRWHDRPWKSYQLYWRMHGGKP